MSNTEYPPHIADLDADDQDLWTAWVEVGGEPDFTIDQIHELLVAARDTEDEVIEECVDNWMMHKSINVDTRIVINYRLTFDTNRDLRQGYDIVEVNDRFFAFIVPA